MDAASLAKVRLAPSPVLETTSWLQLTADGSRHPLFGDPGPNARLALRHPDVALIASAVTLSSSYTPDLLTPQPPTGTWSQALRRQLEMVRETPTKAVTTQLMFSEPTAASMPTELRRAMESDAFARRAANGLHLFYKGVLADRWQTLENAVSGEIARRAHTMATMGVGALLGSVHPKARWSGDDLNIDIRYDFASDFVNTDLVLVPSALGTRLQAQVWDPHDAVVAFPVTTFGADPRKGLPTLADLLGASRAAILRDLTSPSSTTALAGRLGIAPSTVSYHLGVLLGSGLAARERKGPIVEYRRTDGGDTLLRQAR